MQEELKPCPFCGTTPIAYKSGSIECNNEECPSMPSVNEGNIYDAVHQWNTRAETEDSELLTIAYMSGQADESARHRTTRQALNALLHYIDHAGTWPSEDWNMDRVRRTAK